MSDLYRVYAPDELGKDGYPPEWHSVIKHQVRAVAGDRCIRCHHPYSKGDGEWSACDEACAHWGPSRYADGDPIPADRQAVDRGILVREGAEIEAQWRILTVHHLNGNKADCRWWNLTALCQRCHLLIQGKVRMERRWLHEHSEWFKPYVAGYYAATLLGEELTRSEVEARLDELLGLEERQMVLAEPLLEASHGD